MVLKAKCSAAPVFLENTDEVFLREVASLSTAVWVFGVPRNRGSTRCLSVLCPEKCNSEDVCVHRKISWRVLLVWLIIVAQRRKKNEVLDYINRLFPFSSYKATCFEFANLILFRLWCMTHAQGFFAKDVSDLGSVVSFRGLPSTLNFHLHGSALIPRLYSGRRLLFRAPGKALWLFVRDLRLNDQQETRGGLLCRIIVEEFCIFSPTPKVFVYYAIVHE